VTLLHDAAQIIETIATLYGLGGALAVLLQAQHLLKRGTSCDVSARFLTVYVGGYAVWLLYGISIGSLPIIVADAAGLACGIVTLSVTLALRRRRPCA
jgi:MtN3 and saliva related transmembrane protein